MSLQDNKNALFGKGAAVSVSDSIKTTVHSKTAYSEKIKLHTTSTLAPDGVTPVLTGAAREKKLEDAREFSRQGTKYLTKTMV